MKSYITGLKNDGTNELLRDVKRAEAAYYTPGQEEVTEYEADNIKKNLNEKNLTQPNDLGENGIKALLKLSSRLAAQLKDDFSAERTKKSIEKIKEIIAKIDPRIVKEAEKQIAEEQKQTKPLGTFEKAKDKIAKNQAEKNEMLFNAVIKGDTVAIQNALAVGANIEARDGRGNTPLMVAAHVDQPQSVAILIESGANVNARNYQNLTALHVVNEQPDVINSPEHPDYYANIEARLIKAGADVNAKDIHGRTPMMVADNIVAVQALKEAGAEVNQDVKDYWKNEDKEDLVNEYESYEQENQAYSGGYKSEERLREEAAYLSQDQGEDEHEQQGQSA